MTTYCSKGRTSFQFHWKWFRRKYFYNVANRFEILTLNENGYAFLPNFLINLSWRRVNFLASPPSSTGGNTCIFICSRSFRKVSPRTSRSSRPYRNAANTRHITMRPLRYSGSTSTTPSVENLGGMEKRGKKNQICVLLKRFSIQNPNSILRMKCLHSNVKGLYTLSHLKNDRDVTRRINAAKCIHCESIPGLFLKHVKKPA